MNWYKNTTEELLHTLQTTRQGLSSEERNQRLAKQGENKITEAAQIPTWKKVGKHFTDLLMLVLIVAAVLKGALLWRSSSSMDSSATGKSAKPKNHWMD